MPIIPPTGHGPKHPPKIRERHAHPHKRHRRRRGHRGHKGHRAHKGHKSKQPKTLKPVRYRQGPGVAAAEAGASADPGDDRVSAAVSAGTVRPALELDAPGMASGVDAGLLGAVLRLAGKGDLGGAALGAWQREQDRLANRAWRRPGGLQRMGGL